MDRDVKLIAYEMESCLLSINLLMAAIAAIINSSSKDINHFLYEAL